jgi:type I restriction-modification system DNA methylase subunit
MNLLLHGLGNEKNIAAGKDSLAAKPSVNFDMVLTNPPFGKEVERHHHQPGWR